MASKQHQQSDFSLGELAPDYIRRADGKVRSRSLRAAKNARILASGAMKARPGTVVVDEAGADGVLFHMTINTAAFVLALIPGSLRIYDKAGRTLVTAVAAPWTAAQIPDLVITSYSFRAYVFHPTLQPQVITMDPDTHGWSVKTFVFADGYSGSLRQAYYRFAPKGVGIRPQAVNGHIELETSAAYFAPGHAGLRLQIQGREVLITDVVSPTLAHADVIQELYPTQRITVDTTPNFEVGEQIKGTTSAATGEVVNVDGANVDVLRTNFTDWSYVSGSTPPGEVVVGENAAPRLTGPEGVSPFNDAFVLDWTEQAMSDLRGWPATGVIHDNRLMMARLPLAPLAILGSGVNDFADFLVGVNADDAFFVILGDADSGRIQHLYSAEQLLILTSRALLYVPESESYPLTPTTFKALRVGPDGSSTTRPVTIAEGVIYVQTKGGAVMGAFPTGDVRRSWRTASMSSLASHLIRQPVSLAYVSGAPTLDERYIYAVLADGTVSVVTYDGTDAEAIPGWTPWDTYGGVRSVSALDGECWALVRRPFAGADRFLVEVFDETRLLDGVVGIGPSQFFGTASGETITGPDGAKIEAPAVYTAPLYRDVLCALTLNGVFQGTTYVNPDGRFASPVPGDGALEIGFAFDFKLTPWPPLDAEDENARRRKRRISGAVVRYTGALHQVNGQPRPAYDAGDDISAAPPVRAETWRTPCFGWSFEPTVDVERQGPAPMEVYAIDLEVAG